MSVKLSSSNSFKLSNCDHQWSSVKSASIDTNVKLAGDEAKDRLYEPKHKKKLVRVLTVVAYVFFVSLAAIMLSLYYIFLWVPDSGMSDTDKLVCYYGSWATYRPGDGACKIEHIDPKLCTHLIYAFIGFDENGTVGINESPTLDRIVQLKSSNSQLKVLISIGGWSQKSSHFSRVMGNREKRARFINSTITFLNRFDLDGVELDWEYPGLRGGSSKDKLNFARLLEEFRYNDDFRSKKYLLTAAVGATRDNIDASYEICALNEYLDFVNVMAYDYNGPWEGSTTTGHNAPIQSVISSINCWLNAGLQRSKLILGVPAYGRVFNLVSRNNATVGAEIVETGNEGPYTRETGTIGYNEICEYLRNDNWTTSYDCEEQVPFMTNGNQWISYDDPRSIRRKVKTAKNKNLGGIMVWSCDMDDFCDTSGDRYAIQQAIKEAMRKNNRNENVQTSATSNSGCCS